MAFPSAKFHREGSVDCLFLIQGVVCSVMLLWLHIKLEAAVVVFEMLPSTKNKDLCAACAWNTTEVLWPVKALNVQ